MATAVKTFTEVFNEIKENVSKSKSGNPVKSFSRADFDRLAKAYLNTPGYTIDKAVFAEDTLMIEQIESVKMLRGMIQKVLLDFGVDKQEAERILTDYEFKNVDGIYELCSELIYQYMNAGKKFDFIPQEDFVGSMTLKVVEETITEHRDIRNPDQTFRVEKGTHKQLQKKSKTPKWKKKKLK